MKPCPDYLGKQAPFSCLSGASNSLPVMEKNAAVQSLLSNIFNKKKGGYGLMSCIKVLIVDDVTETRANLKRLLQLEPDIKVIGEAANGKEAIRQAEDLRPDVVLMDINMPVMNGLRASEAITLAYPAISIIILSVQGEPEYLERARLAGARDFLTKPFTIDELVKAIRQAYNPEKKHEKSWTAASDYGFA